MKMLVFFYTFIIVVKLSAQVDPSSWHLFENPDNSSAQTSSNWPQSAQIQISLEYQSAFSNDYLYYIIVAENIYSAVEQNVMIYVNDIELMDIKVHLYKFSDGGAVELRNYLSGGLGQGLKGALLIGDLPYALSGIERVEVGIGIEDYYPCDLYFMDLDGLWGWSNTGPPFNIEYISSHSVGQGDVAPEIYISRIFTNFSTGDDALRINQYLQRNHSYRSNQYTVLRQDYALVMLDDEWDQAYHAFLNDIKENFYQVNLHSNQNGLDNTLKEYYAEPHGSNSELQNGYEFVEVAVHTMEIQNSFYHNFKDKDEEDFETDKIYSSDINACATNTLFFNLFACRAGNYSMGGYLAGHYLFNPDGNTIALISSAKSGGLLEANLFHTQFAAGKSFGETFLNWFQVQGSNGFDDYDKQWFYGLTLLGDPLAHMRGFIYENNKIDNFQYDFISPVTGKPVIDDLDSNGQMEIIITSENGSITKLDQSSNLLWSTTVNPYSLSTPSILREGSANKIIVSDKKGYLYGLASDGSSLNWSPFHVFHDLGSGALDEIAVPVIADLNLDGNQDMIIRGALDPPSIWPQSAGAVESTVDSMYVFDNNANLLWRQLLPTHIPIPVPAVGDVLFSSNGREVVVLSNNIEDNIYYVNILNGANGNTISSMSANGQVSASPVLADIDGNGKLDIVYGMSSGTVKVLNNNLTELWSFNACGPVSSVIVNDLDNDGSAEVVIATNGTEIGQRSIYSISKTGQEIFQFPVNAAIPDNILVGNITDDSSKEILCSNSQGIYVLNHDGSLAYNGFLFGDQSLSCSVSDINSNGVPDVLSINHESILGAYQFSGSVSSTDWLTYRNNNQHDGLLNHGLKGSEIPLGLSVTAQNNHPYLTWQPVYNPNLSHYEIWKKKTTFPWILWDTSQNESYSDLGENFDGDPKNRTTAYYKIKSVDNFNYASGFSNMVSIQVNGQGLGWFNVSDSLQKADIVVEYSLKQNYPNPFNPETTISFNIPLSSHVVLKVYNIRGQLIDELVNSYLEKGKYSYKFLTANLPSGIYFYVIEAGEFRSMNRMLLLK